MTAEVGAGPKAAAGDPEEKARIRECLEKRGITGAANDLRWDRLIETMRARDTWRPSFRFKCVDSEHVSGWDVEWWYHLPFPMMSVEWFDIGMLEKQHRGQIVDPAVVDHSEWISVLLEELRFCFEPGKDFVRIFGYLPKNYEGFEPPDANL